MSINILLNIACCVLDIEISISSRILLDVIFIAPYVVSAINTALKKKQEPKIITNKIKASAVYKHAVH